MISKIPLKTMIDNAKTGITSRKAYIDEIVQNLMDTPLYLFYDRELGQKTKDVRSTMMLKILDTLDFPESCLDNTLKDLIFLIVKYRNSPDENLKQKSESAIWLLAEIVENHNRYPFD